MCRSRRRCFVSVRASLKLHLFRVAVDLLCGTPYSELYEKNCIATSLYQVKSLQQMHSVLAWQDVAQLDAWLVVQWIDNKLKQWSFCEAHSTSSQHTNPSPEIADARFVTTASPICRAPVLLPAQPVHPILLSICWLVGGRQQFVKMLHPMRCYRHRSSDRPPY